MRQMNPNHPTKHLNQEGKAVDSKHTDAIEPYSTAQGVPYGVSNCRGPPYMKIVHNIWDTQYLQSYRVS